jgi:hypothetical protein
VVCIPYPIHTTQEKNERNSELQRSEQTISFSRALK